MSTQMISKCLVELHEPLYSYLAIVISMTQHR